MFENVLVTGGAGFIGSHIVEELLRNHNPKVVHVVDNLERGLLANIPKSNKVIFHKADLRNPNSMKLFSSVDCVFHLAFKVGGIPYTGAPQFFYDLFNDASKIDHNVIDACVKYNVEKLVYTSSACVYPSNKQQVCSPLREDDAFPAQPDDAYGWAKIVGELYCKWAYENKWLKSAVIRPFNVVGEREYAHLQYGHFVPVMCLKAILHPKVPFVVQGDGSNTRSFVYVRDVVSAMMLAMEKVDDATPINVGSVESLSVKDVVDKVVKFSGRDIVPEYDVDFYPTGVRARVPDLSRAKDLLGWVPLTSFDEMLARTFNWCKEKVKQDG